MKIEVNLPITVTIHWECREDDSHLSIVNELIDAIEPIVKKHGDGVQLLYTETIEPGTRFTKSDEPQPEAEEKKAA